MGFVSLAAGVGLAFVLIATEAPRPLRLIIFFPFWIAGLGMLQSRARVCIALAARGLRNMDGGSETIENNGEADGLRVKAKEVNRRALITAAIIASVVLVFPAKFG
ncbi:MAG: hypothetical protein WKF30_05340 [Pyrinomonadaceae bacterium]